MAVHLHPGRDAHVAPSRLRAPDSALTRAATQAATRILPPVLLGHSHRTYTFGRALGELEGIDVDTELLYAAALLHDTGLVLAAGTDDFTLSCAVGNGSGEAEILSSDLSAEYVTLNAEGYFRRQFNLVGTPMAIELRTGRNPYAPKKKR